MVGIRKVLAVITVMLMVACTVPVACDQNYSDAAGDNGGVLLFQVNPWGDSEGFTLKNYSQSNVDLKGYTVADGVNGKEGSYTFTSSFVLGPGETVTVVKKNTGDIFSSQANVLADGDSGLKRSGSFGLSNSGDNLILTGPAGNLLDAFCYGSYKDSLDGWAGEPVVIKKNFFSERRGDFDSDSADDWFNSIPGQTHLEFEPGLFTADVTPFLFPDSGGIPVYNALEKAEKSVSIQIYELRSPNVWGLLVELEKRGVEVRVLHEGDPVGGTIPQHIAPYMKFFIQNGGEVRFIGGTDADRFNNMHAKYAVIDGSTVIVTSENWSTSNMNGHLDDNPYSGQDGNRGWGAVLESPAYAQYMMDVFDNDYSAEFGDTRDFMDVHPESKCTECWYKAPEAADFPRYENVKITPVVSNDNSAEAIEYYINGAQERLYSQQQNYTFNDSKDDKSPINLMKQKAADGVDTRFILGCGFSTGDSEKAGHTVDNINSMTRISATTMDKPYVHNKGLISDDSVWISSINWTPDSVNMNRECCVVIDSKEIADMFAKNFLEDFDRNYDYDGFRIDTSEIQSSYPAGEEIVFEVAVIPEGEYTYHWDFGDGTVRDTSIPKVVYKPAEGAHLLKVTVTDGTGNTNTIEKDYYVGEDPANPDVPGPTDPDQPVLPDIPGLDEEALADFMPYLVPILAVLIALCLAVSKIRNRGSKKSKGKKRK